MSTSATSASTPTPTPTPGRGAIRLEGVSHRYGATTTLDALSLDVPAGSFTVVVGPSGSGKSTVLQIVAGLLTPAAGTVAIDGVDVTDRPPGRRDLAMVFQDYALYPHMTVAGNVGFALRLDAKHGRRPRDRKAIDRAVAETCSRLGLDGLLGRRPAELSGGQRQRVAIARALVRRPGVLLLDEPLSAVDAQLRQQTRTELLRLHREVGGTVVLVTHDQTEALSLASHLAVLDDGRCAQAGAPAELYRRPESRFVAEFLGSPPMNLTPADSGTHVIGWRPHDGVLGDLAEPALRLCGVVELVEYTGDGYVLHCADLASTWTVTTSRLSPVPHPGDPVHVAVPAAAVHTFDADGRRVDAPHLPTIARQDRTAV